MSKPEEAVMIATTRPEMSVVEPTLYVALELSEREWKLAMSSGVSARPWVRTVPARDLGALDRALQQGRTRFGLAATATVTSCYEAGRDGFWIHRALLARGVHNRVVDSASIDVNRRARQQKTDRVDALKLLRLLLRTGAGEVGVWREVRVPSAAVEAARHVSRERATLLADQTRLANQIGGWLATCGCVVSRTKRRERAWWTQVRDWAGAPLPTEVQDRIARAVGRLHQISEQVQALEATQRLAQQTATSGLGWCG
jgi:transposase